MSYENAEIFISEQKQKNRQMVPGTAILALLLTANLYSPITW